MICRSIRVCPRFSATLYKRGYKILLEIVCRAGKLNIAELPYVFHDRHEGISKLSAGVAWEFIRSLWDLRDTRKQRGPSPIDW